METRLAKRDKRFKSMFVDSQVSVTDQKVFAAAKRTKRSNTISDKSVSIQNQIFVAPAAKKNIRQNSQTGPDSNVSILVELNCKLTNDVLLTKKHLAEKNDELIKIQKEYNLKTIECCNLQIQVHDLQKKVHENEMTIEKLRPEQFCEDLISFDDGVFNFCIDVIFSKHFLYLYYDCSLFS